MPLTSPPCADSQRPAWIPSSSILLLPKSKARSVEFVASAAARASMSLDLCNSPRSLVSGLEAARTKRPGSGLPALYLNPTPKPEPTSTSRSALFSVSCP